MSGDEHAAPPPPSDDDGFELSLFRRAVRLLTPWGVKHALQLRFQKIDDTIGVLVARVDRSEARLDGAEAAVRSVQLELADVRDHRLKPFEGRLDAIETTIRELSAEVSRLRDGMVPAAVTRCNVLVDRLAEELEETASLVERMLRSEPLPVADVSTIDEARLAGALADVQPRLLEAFRGSESEIRHRLDSYLDDLRPKAPVLDLGCGRGELLLLLREGGVDATGVEGDPALAAAAVRRGLRVVEGDVSAVLQDLESGAYGAVTAIHLLEHLPPSEIAAVVSEVRRVLRPGGLFVAECPNPHSLRVGASLFWLDPTHARPLLPETLELFLRAGGFEIVRSEELHPFPDDQLFSGPGARVDVASGAGPADLAARVDRLGARLDGILNRPRDFAVWAVRPATRPESEADHVLS